MGYNGRVFGPPGQARRSPRSAWLAGLIACASCGGGAGAASGRDSGVGDDASALVDLLDPPDGFPTDLIDPQSRTGAIVSSLTTGDWEFLRRRPGFAAQKLALMAGDPFTFFRGSLALFLHDWEDPLSGLGTTRFGSDGALVLGLGDAHPENFGTMRTASGIFRVEPNDFDTADLLPYLWDVRRFGVGMCLAARLANPGDPAAQTVTATAARAVVRAAVASYAATLSSLAAGGARPAIEDGRGNPVLDDLFTRSLQDWDRHAELAQLTDAKPTRTFIRGTPDPAQPLRSMRDLPAAARLTIAPAIAKYRGTLPAPPPITALVPLDAVQQFGVGVGSFPRVRALVLVRGATTNDADDVLLEIKELPPQGAPPLPRPSGFPTPQARLMAALTAGWTAPGADPLWGVGAWLGGPVQIRTEAEGHKTIRLSRLEGPLGTPDAVSGLGSELARLIAGMHAAPIAGRPSSLGAIAAAIATDPVGFTDEQADVAVQYCDRVSTDWSLFQQALAVAGPTLGVAGDPANAPSPDLRVLYDPQADPTTAGIDPVIGPLVLNELAAVGGEFVEVANVGTSSLAVGGYSIADSDEDGGPRFGTTRFASAALLPAGGYLVVWGGYGSPAAGPQTACKSGLSPCYHAQWGISASSGETMYLLGPDDVIVDQRSYPSDPGALLQSWSRLPDGRGPFAPASPTPSRANGPPP